MPNSLITGVSGLSSHQKMIEIVGQNLANLNTIGFKTRTANFSDVLYETVRGGTGGSGTSGGTNPVQIGSGSQLSSISTNFTQGNLATTGSAFDFAIEGEGFFVVDSGEDVVYSRAGAFQVDKNGLLVDAGTGYPVQRYGTIGEPDGVNPSFQTPGNSNISIPLGAAVPGHATTTAMITGNLPSNATGPTQEILESVSALTASATPATSGTLINDLDLITSPYQSGDTITVTGTDADGTAISTTIPVDGTTTVGDLVNQLDAAFGQGTFSLTSDGTLSLAADEPGQSYLSVSLADDPSNVGSSDISQLGFIATQAGGNGTVVRGGMQIYDERGGVHNMTIEFSKQADGTWNLNGQMDPSDGIIIDGAVEGITFDSSGKFAGVTGTGNGNASMSFQFTGQTTPQVVHFDLGEDGVVGGGMTSYSADASISSSQDGLANGVLTSVQVDANGTIQGIASNGQQFPLAQLAIASFNNPHGLESLGNNFYRTSLSSGEVQIGTAAAGGNGRIRSNQLEQSNVDIAVEFTRLIIAQRGFSANARTITVTDEILQELTSLIR